MSNIILVNSSFEKPSFEFVERKGLGHPDTLSDMLAESLSCRYSNYTKEKYGAVLHHNFDKVGLLGGSSFVTFGNGYLLKPIRVLINGRVSTRFAESKIPTRKLITLWVKDFFIKNLPQVDVNKDLEIHFNLSSESSPGKTYEKGSEKGKRHNWFEPRSLDDLGELKQLNSNDTSLGVGYAPLSILEKLVLQIEETLLSENFKKENPWIGSDIKTMAFRDSDNFNITMCVPQIANYVKNINEYKGNLVKAKKTVEQLMGRNSINNYSLHINTRDNYELCELYLTATGSSIESGDEGLVGRGNRINGLITPGRPMSMEGSCGKNPVYHIGKLYYLAANDLAKKIYSVFKVPCEVFLVSQSGRSLVDPWFTVVKIPSEFKERKELEEMISEYLFAIPSLTEKILKAEFKLC